MCTRSAAGRALRVKAQLISEGFSEAHVQLRERSCLHACAHVSWPGVRTRGFAREGLPTCTRVPLPLRRWASHGLEPPVIALQPSRWRREPPFRLPVNCASHPKGDPPLPSRSWAGAKRRRISRGPGSQSCAWVQCARSQRAEGHSRARKPTCLRHQALSPAHAALATDRLALFMDTRGGDRARPPGTRSH